MLEAVSVALHAVAVSDLKGGESTLVIGAGMIGLLTLQAARAAGCTPIFVADVDATRLKLAEEMGSGRHDPCLGRSHGGGGAAPYGDAAESIWFWKL